MGHQDRHAYLSGMITGQFTGQIFSPKIWNKKVTDDYESIDSTHWMKDLFDSEMDDKTVINSLNSNRSLHTAIK